jgi:OmcA/MtrC family decaheme c-type cytochrome
MSSVGGCLRFLAMLSVAPFAASLSGCGDEGPAGPAGAEGPPGDTIVVIEDPDTLVLTITGVTIVNGYPVVDLAAETETGFAITTLTNSNLRFTFAKLTPGTDGDASAWQSYINQAEVSPTSDGGPGPGTVDTIQATYDRNGELTNNNDGTYSYTFVNDVTAIASPLAVAWEPTLTHRVAIQVGGFPATNPIYDFIPDTGATTDLFTREIVATGSCNECHNPIALHGGGRIETQYCVTCHNPGSADANSGNTIDFKVMVHKIHMGADLPSVQAGGDYTIWGYRDSTHDYSDVEIPMDVRNCTKCHDGSDAETVDADNWQFQPTMEACGSCHDDVVFADGIAGGHPGGVVTNNADCTICHSEDLIAGSVAEEHEIPEQTWAGRFEYNILSVVDTAPTEFPSITYSVTDPTNSDAPYDLQNDPEFTSGSTRLALDVAWSTTDYDNASGDRAPATPLSLNALSGTDNLDGTYTIVSGTAVPAGAVGSGAVGFEGHPAGDFDGDGTYSDEVPVTGAVAYFAITDASPVDRRLVVDTENCLQCHADNDGLALHGGNRTDNVQLCVLCHNPNNTDLAMRPTDPDGIDNGVNTAAPDGREERSIDFKMLIHSIHASEIREDPFIVYGFFNSVHDFSDVEFPGDVADCETCHLEDTYTLPLSGSRLATTVDAGATVLVPNPFGAATFDDAGAAADPSDDGNITPVAAACSSCHDDATAQVHMELNGAAFSMTQPDIDAGVTVETCEICHGEGRVADVEAVHEEHD